MNIKRWLLCGFLFLICFLILHWLNNNSIGEIYGGSNGRESNGRESNGRGSKNFRNDSPNV